MVKSLKLALAMLVIGAAAAQAEERAQFYIPDPATKLIYLFTCKAETTDAVQANWDKARVVFAEKHQKRAAELELATKAQRDSGHAPSQDAIDAHNKQFTAHKAAVAADLTPLGCRMDGLMHMP